MLRHNVAIFNKKIFLHQVKGILKNQVFHYAVHALGTVYTDTRKP